MQPCLCAHTTGHHNTALTCVGNWTCVPNQGLHRGCHDNPLTAVDVFGSLIHTVCRWRYTPSVNCLTCMNRPTTCGGVRQCAVNNPSSQISQSPNNNLEIVELSVKHNTALKPPVITVTSQHAMVPPHNELLLCLSDHKGPSGH